MRVFCTSTVVIKFLITSNMNASWVKCTGNNAVCLWAFKNFFVIFLFSCLWTKPTILKDKIIETISMCTPYLDSKIYQFVL